MRFDVENERVVIGGLSLTKDQANAANGIIDFIGQNDFDSTKYVVGLIGSGGTGKTFITNYIIEHCKYSNSVIKCISSTHKACRVFSQAINGKSVDTIHKTFGFRLDMKLEDFNPSNPRFAPIASPKLENIRVLFVDEASMIPVAVVKYILDTCKALQIKVIFIGDDDQLSPVNENRSTAFLRCFKLYRLNEIVRQGVGNPILELLDMLRYDIEHKTYKFIEFVSKHIGTDNYNSIDEGYSICAPNSFKRIIDNSFSDEEYTKNIDMYRIIAYTNNRVSFMNNYIRNSIIRDADKNILTKNDLLMSYETIVDEFMDIILSNSEEYIINDIGNFTDSKYGFKGFITRFQLVHGGSITKPLFVIDHRDKFTIMSYCKVLSELIDNAKKATGATRVSKWKEYYSFKKKYLLAINIKNSNGNVLFERDIDYAFAITSHKAQGSTYNTVFMDMNDMIYDKNGGIYTNYDDILRRLYVGCSRAHSKLIIGYGKG